MEKCMNEILIKTDELIDSIKNSSDYIEYTKLKNMLLSNDSIMTLINDVKSLQKQLVRNSVYKKDITNLEEQIDEKLKKLNSNPDYVRYTYLEEDLNTRFQVIKDILEKHINNITN